MNQNNGKPNGDRRDNERVAVNHEVEFILYLDAYKATAVDISKTGIRFETKTPITIELHAENIHGKKLAKKAQIVWARKNEDGRVTYGFEFIGDA